MDHELPHPVLVFTQLVTVIAIDPSFKFCLVDTLLAIYGPYILGKFAEAIATDHAAINGLVEEGLRFICQHTTIAIAE